MFSQVSVCPQWGLCPGGGSLSEGSLSTRVSVHGGLCPGDVCLRVLCLGGLCPGEGSLSRGGSVREIPLHSYVFVVRVLLEYILVFGNMFCRSVSFQMKVCDIYSLRNKKGIHLCEKCNYFDLTLCNSCYFYE